MAKGKPKINGTGRGRRANRGRGGCSTTRSTGRGRRTSTRGTGMGRNRRR